MFEPPRRKTPVIVNARFLNKQLSGVDRFAAETLRAWLPRFGVARNATMLGPSGKPPHTDDLTHRVASRGTLNGHWWEQLELAVASKDHILLNLCNTAPALRRQQLVVLHDAATFANPQDYGFAFRASYRALFAALMARTKVIATVSRFSASELGRFLGYRHKGIEVIYESGEHVLRHASDPNILARLKLSGRPYVLAVGSRSRNKNFNGVARAAGILADLGVTLVATGGDNRRVFAHVAAAAGNIVHAGYVSDGELRALYENARCFVYPSFYEGFGLPPLEAMHCGCPVIVSRRASLPEICGGAALYFDPADAADIARCMRRVLSSENLRLDLRELGLQRVALFSWARAAEQLEDLLSRNFDCAV